jgi:hypothetical protein
MPLQAVQATRPVGTRPARRAPASWRRFAARPRNPVTGVSMAGPWSGLKPYALRLVKHEHRVLGRMLKELDRARTAGERARRLARFEAEYVAYSRNVHEVLYPAYRAQCRTERQRGLYHEMAEMHRQVELLLLDANRADPGSARAAGCAKALRLACADLFREEERHLFRQARRLLGRTRLKSLGRAMQDHRRAILRNPNLPARLARTA